MNDVSKCDVIIWHLVSSYKPFFIGLMFRIFRPSFVGKEWWWRENYGNVVVVLTGWTMSISALKQTHQLRGMDSTFRIRATISPQQRQLFRPRQGESRSTTLNFQLHRRQLLAVGWELQNSSPTECVWRTAQSAQWGVNSGIGMI